MASGRYATRTILVMRDAQSNDEIVCRGDATTCARLIGTSSKNVMSAYKRHGKCKGKYIFEFAGYEEVRPNANRVTAKDLRMLRIVPEDIRSIRRKTQIGTLVSCYRYDDRTSSHVKRYVGDYPIVEKYRHIFTVQMNGFQESYSWIDLIRKDGVAIVS